MVCNIYASPLRNTCVVIAEGNIFLSILLVTSKNILNLFFSEKKRVLCDLCGKSFAGRNSMNTHRNKHDEAKRMRHKCSHCEFATYASCALKIDIQRRHTTITEKLACPNCKTTFKEKHNLTVHLRKKHGLSNDEIKNIFNSINL